MYLIDTNVLVSEILTEQEQDPLTRAYRTAYANIPLIQRVISDVILTEFELYMIGAIPKRYKMGEKEKRDHQTITSKYIKSIIDNCNITSSPHILVKQAYALYQRYEQTHYISFTDSIFLTIGKQHQYVLFTKDRRINTLAKELNVAVFEITNNEKID